MYVKIKYFKFTRFSWSVYCRMRHLSVQSVMTSIAIIRKIRDKKKINRSRFEYFQ